MVQQKKAFFSFGLNSYLPTNNYTQNRPAGYMMNRDTVQEDNETEHVKAILFEKNYARIVYYPVVRAVFIEWLGYCTSEEYKDTLKFVFKQAVSRGCVSWLTNLNRWITVNAETEQWMQDKFLIHFETASLKNMGIMLNGNVFDYIHAERMAVRLQKADFKVRFFLDEAVAYEWLEKNTVETL